MAKEQCFVDDEVYPAEASEQGCNAYYLDKCDHVGHRPAYAACLKKVAERQHGRLDACNADCSAAIGKKDCLAAKMRKEEIVSGKAIYFINRQKLQAFYRSVEEIERAKLIATPVGQWSTKKPSRSRSVETITTPPPPPAKPKHFLDIDTGGYVDAINAATKTEVSKGVVMSAPAGAGMSLLEMARQMVAAKAAF